MVIAYYKESIPRIFWASWDWAIGQGLSLTVVLAVALPLFVIVFEVVCAWRRYKTWAEAKKHIRSAVGRFLREIIVIIIVAPTILFVIFFIQDAPNQIRIRDEKIVRLGGAPDVPVSIPRLADADREKAVNMLSRLSDIMNTDARQACDLADRLQNSYGSRQERPSVYAAQARDIFSMTRMIYTVLLGQQNNGGILKSGDPIMINIMAQAIQSKDHDIIIQFDGYALSTSNLLSALDVADRSAERAKLFEPIFTALSIPMNLWRQYTKQFCGLINKTNSRIAELRSALY